MMLDTATRQRLEARTLALRDDAARVPSSPVAYSLDVSAIAVLDFLRSTAADPVTASGLVRALERQVVSALGAYGLAPSFDAMVTDSTSSTKPKPVSTKPKTSSTTPPPMSSTPAVVEPVVAGPVSMSVESARGWWAQRSTLERVALGGAVVLGAVLAYRTMRR